MDHLPDPSLAPNLGFYVPDDSTTYTPLTKVRIGRADAGFAKFLARVPDLVDLQCMELDQDLVIPVTTVPRLKRFNGPISLARLLLPGRPLEEVHIRSIFSTPEGLAPGSRSLKSLSFGSFVWETGCVAEISRLFPSLEILKIHVSRGNPDVSPSSRFLYKLLTTSFRAGLKITSSQTLFLLFGIFILSISLQMPTVTSP